MTKNLFALFCLLAALSSKARQTTSYQAYEGRIDRFPIRLYLHQSAHQYTGFYDYTRNGIPISFSGNDTSAQYPGQIVLLASPISWNGREVPAEWFYLQKSGDSLRGTWQTDDGKRKFEVAIGAARSEGPALSWMTSSGDTRLRVDTDDSPSASFDESLIWPVGNHPAVASFRKALLKFLDWPDSIRSPHAWIAKRKKDFLIENNELFRSLADSDWMQFPQAYQITESNQMFVQSMRSDFVTLVRSHYSYTGGAHGYYFSRYFNFDWRNRKKIQLKDIFMPSGIIVGPSFLERSFREKMKLLSSESLTDAGLFEEKIPMTENFYLTGSGIVFCYAPYEIGPYAMGEVELILSYTQMKAYLQPAFAKRMLP